MVSPGPEYGTMEAAWKGILTESERVSDVHLKVKENLCIGEIQQIKTWQKDNYHKVNWHILSKDIFLLDFCSCVVDSSILIAIFLEYASNKRAQRNGGSVQKSAETMGKAFGESRKNQSRLSRGM